MTRGTSSSQVGLFSTQISEQIIRLRALSRGQDGPSEAHQVDLRRAVMATRLLAGSARIMRLDVLQAFLEELLEWLQHMEQSKHPLNTTQALILESVVELEESLMLHLDEVEQETGADLSPFQSQVDDLLTLIRHNTDKIEGLSVESLAADAVEEPDDAADEGAGPEGLDSIAAWFEQAIEGAATHDELEELGILLVPGLDRLKSLHVKLQARIDATLPGIDPGPIAEGLSSVDDPRHDPVFGDAASVLLERGREIGANVHVDAFGDTDVIAEGLQPRVREILKHLASDVAATLEPRENEGDPSAFRVSFTMRAEDGRALIQVVDDGPQVHGSPLLGDPDHLSMLGGLRRARKLLEQTQGLIRVASEDDDARFVLSVPLDTGLSRYRILTLEDGRVAIPAALVDAVIDAGGLLYETDESGESVERGGRSVPLADLALFIDEIVPARGPSPRIAIVGSVEKRVGLGCEDEGSVLETDGLSDAPAGWGPVAYGAIDLDGEDVPVIDVKRLLALRFRLGEQLEISGSPMDPHVDSFVPAEVEVPTLPDEVEFEPESSQDPEEPESSRPRTFERALLVNQSEFRRRDLARTLEGLGLEVEVTEDLADASLAIEKGEVDLLVTDLRLGQEGGESFHTLREKHPRLTIVLTSSVAQQYASELAEKTGAHRCWLDPYRKSDLDAVLRELTA